MCNINDSFVNNAINPDASELHQFGLDYSPNFLSLPGNSEYGFHLKINKLLSQKGNEVLVRDLETPQELQKKPLSVYLDCHDQKSSKLPTRTPYCIVIYSFEQEHYK